MIRAIKGTKDVLPKESRKWQDVERISRDILRLYGYEEIRTPVIEETALFVKTIGEDTDIVRKEMFSFEDRGERRISLRPEGTAPIVRAYLENSLDKTDAFQKLYYIGPMFRAERPQAGRLRQFHQIGLEAIGAMNPALDAEVINVLTKILDAVGIKGYQLKLNNLGCRADKARLSKALKGSFAAKEKALCDDCKRRVKTNPLRVLDCKNDDCRRIVRGVYKEADFLCGDCVKHFDSLLKYLKSLKIPYVVDPYIVRGLDYYTKTVFEVTHASLGSQDAIGAGGRYDDLISDMGGPKTGAAGFALGFERVLLALQKGHDEFEKAAGRIDVFMATLGEAAREKAFLLAEELRSNKMACDIDYEARSLKSQMRAADKCGAKIVVILGEDEMEKGEATIRDMRTKQQFSVKFGEVAAAVRSRI